jgi:DNA-binding beta-propeller fold protein YncE
MPDEETMVQPFDDSDDDADDDDENDDDSEDAQELTEAQQAFLTPVVVEPYVPKDCEAYRKQEKEMEEWIRNKPDRIDYKTGKLHEIGMKCHLVQYPYPYGRDALGRDYRFMGKKFDASFGEKGNGPLQFNEPQGVAITKRGHILIADQCNNRVQEVMITKDKADVVNKFGEKGIEREHFRMPQGIAVHRITGEIAVADSTNCRIKIYGPGGDVLGLFGKSGKKRGQLRNPRGVAWTHDGYIVVCDEGNHRVCIMDKNGGVTTAIGEKRGTDLGEFQFPTGVAMDWDSGMIVVCDQGNHRIQMFTREGSFVRVFGGEGEGPGKFRDPYDVAFSPIGDLVVTDQKNGRVQIFWPTGAFCTEFGNAVPRANDEPDWFVSPTSIDYDGETVAVSDYRSCEIKTFHGPRRAHCGAFGDLPREFVLDVFRMLHYYDAGAAAPANKFVLKICRDMRWNWEVCPLEPGTPEGTEMKLGKICKVMPTELFLMNHLWDKWGQTADRRLRILDGKVMRFDDGFRSAICDAYGIKVPFLSHPFYPTLFIPHSLSTRQISDFHLPLTDTLAVLVQA